MLDKKPFEPIDYLRRHIRPSCILEKNPVPGTVFLKGRKL